MRLAIPVPKHHVPVVHYQPASSGLCVGTPGILALPNGALLVKCDLFRQAGKPNIKPVTLVYRSDDGGLTWTKIARVQPLFWASLEWHQGAAYLIGVDREPGRIVVRRSLDEGETWTEPSSPSTGLITSEDRFHTAAVPWVVHRGRIWRAFEDVRGPGGWPTFFRSLVASVPEDADLLKRDNWTLSNRLGTRPVWFEGAATGWLEGNIVVTRQGHLRNVLRVHAASQPEIAATVHISARNHQLRYSPKHGPIHFPGGAKKFSIRWDPTSRHYWALSSVSLPWCADTHPERNRNCLVLVRSADLADWQCRAVIAFHPARARHGFHYADWRVDGDDLVAAVRTAGDIRGHGARTAHDSNLITFHRVADFREHLTLFNEEELRPSEAATP